METLTPGTDLVEVPAVLVTKRAYMRVPRRLSFRPAAQETIDAQVNDRLLTAAQDGMKGVQGNAHHVPRSNRKLPVAIFADAQHACSTK